jgi:hypothetical protein
MTMDDSVRTSIGNRLQSALHVRTDGEAARWLEDALKEAQSGPQTRLLALYTEASMRLGRLPLGVLARDHSTTTLEGVALEDWTLEDAARATFLLARADSSPPESFEADARACYEMGDAREQQSWLRAVALMPAPERFLALVVDACRSNIQPVFEAVACGNPYPALYFPERNFNQLVMKSLFNGVRLERIVGLASRANAELARMATDFAAERRAAGRPVPADIGLALSSAAA